jgi:DNA invertase Pin-like site-specific DNA recombinase
VTTIEDLSAYGVAFVSLRDNLDLSTPSGRLMMHIIGAMAQFERELIKERVSAGMHAARKRGSRIGRPRAYTNAGNYFSVLQGIKQRLHDTTRRPRRDVVEPGTPGADRGK